MRSIAYRIRLLAVTFAATLLAAANAGAAPQIVAAVPTGGEAELVCSGGNCATEFSAICLQQSRTTPPPKTAYVIHQPDSRAFSVTGHRPDGGKVALAPGLLRFSSLRGHVAFQASVPAGFLKDRGLVRVTVKIKRLAMLVPEPQDGDSKPQTAADQAQAFRELRVTGEYWSDKNPDNLAMARLTNRIINLLPAKGSVSAAFGEELWKLGAASEKQLSRDSLDFNRSYFDYCRENGLTPGGFPMRRCLGGAHDWFMKDLNLDYWKSLNPTS